MDKDTIIKRLSELGYTIISIPIKDKIGVGEKLDLMDEEGYKYYTKLNNLFVGKKPYRFSKFNPYSIENIQHLLDLKNTGTIILTKEYKDNLQWLEFQCACGRKFYRQFSTMNSSFHFYCGECKTHYNALPMEEVITLLKENGYRILEGEKYVNNFTPILCYDKNNYIISVKINNLKRKNKTSSRQIFSQKSNSKYLIYNINRFFELQNSKTKALSVEPNGKIKCLCDCGEEYLTNKDTILFNHKNRCSKCTKSISRLELLCRQVLNQEKLEYVREKTFSDCVNKYSSRKLRFDFYLPQFNACIECDGEQHFRNNGYYKNMDEFYYRKSLDEQKTEYCSTHNIPLLRIDYQKFNDDEYIKILKEFIFQLKS